MSQVTKTTTPSGEYMKLMLLFYLIGKLKWIPLKSHYLKGCLSKKQKKKNEERSQNIIEKINLAEFAIYPSLKLSS